MILFTNTSEILFDQGAEFFVTKFLELQPARIIVSGDEFCVPKTSTNDYPNVSENEKRFLNADVFVGYASDIFEILSSEETIDNLQLFFVKKFLDEKSRVNLQNEKHVDFNLVLFSHLESMVARDRSTRRFNSEFERRDQSD